MKILVVGGGGREHALIKKLREDPRVTEIFALPGNGGIAADATCVPVEAKDIPGIVRFARENVVDFAVVAPDDPLVLGAVDALEALGVPCFGPNARAAAIEGSKVFSKNLMKKYNIPTAAYVVFDEAEAALSYIERAPLPIVVKADGLALGKGVTIAATHAEAAQAVHDLMRERIFGESGARIVIEEFMEGPEVSVLAFVDGETLVPMVSVMDHKRALDGDTGKNTGGMGTIAPNPFYTPAIARECEERIFKPSMHAMNAEGRPFRGCIFFGLMLTKNGPKLIEYNCRFGDPETQVVLPLLETSLLTAMQAVQSKKLSETEIRFSNRAACCVVLASQGYPGACENGTPLSIPAEGPDEHIYVAGARRTDAGLVSHGGRVLGVTALGDSLREAVGRAYALCDRVQFPRGFCRRDIGARALAALESEED